MSDVTRILSNIESGEAKAASELLPLVYDDLRALAAAKMAAESPGQTLQATALVHEAFVRLVDGQQVSDWRSRGHFFSAAAEAMRRILIDRARKKSRPKHGGDRRRVDLNEVNLECDVLSNDELLDLHDALDRLEKKDGRKAELVKLRFFAGLTIRESAEALGISESLADLDWAYAKTWLQSEMSDRPPGTHLP
jgi:RNA polymerase sigma factor (TIGR02999 family)